MRECGVCVHVWQEGEWERVCEHIGVCVNEERHDGDAM